MVAKNGGIESILKFLICGPYGDLKRKDTVEQNHEICEITNFAKKNDRKEWWNRIYPKFFNPNCVKELPVDSPSGPFSEPHSNYIDAFPKTSINNEYAKN